MPMTLRGATRYVSLCRTSSNNRRKLQISSCPFYAIIAQLVEHHLAMVRVEGSSPFYRSSCNPER